tara:strand:+ start:394 stop:1089 length:696 start_codon:yes stop_codon:yes gene_type:complete
MSDSLKTDKTIDKHLHMLKTESGEISSLSVSTEGNGAKVTGDLNVTGNIKTPNQSTPLSDFDLATKKYVDDNAGGSTSRWSHSWGGFKTSNSSSTTYYFQYYPNNNMWNNADASPTSISYFDIYAAEWIAPADGTLTKIDVFVRGGSDDCQFYVFKGSPSESGSSSLSLTQIGASGACGIDATNKVFHQTATISSSNTFSAGDGLWVMLKKETHSTSTHFYFSGTISGEYS